MSRIFVIEDRFHTEHCGRYSSFADALVELRRRAEIPWEQPPNVAPCTESGQCGRDYVILEFDDEFTPWKELRRVPVFKISASGVEWTGNT